jgi:hypothetical protein
LNQAFSNFHTLKLKITRRGQSLRVLKLYKLMVNDLGIRVARSKGEMKRSCDFVIIDDKSILLFI